MADSVRKQIFKKMETALKEISPLIDVFFGMAPLGKSDALAIVPSQDDFIRSTKLDRRNSLNVAIRYVVKEAFQQALYEYEDVAPLIKAKMDSNRTWDGIAYDTILQNERWLYPDSEHPDTGVDLNYVIEYAP